MVVLETRPRNDASRRYASPEPRYEWSLFAQTGLRKVHTHAREVSPARDLSPPFLYPHAPSLKIQYRAAPNLFELDLRLLHLRLKERAGWLKMLQLSCMENYTYLRPAPLSEVQTSRSPRTRWWGVTEGAFFLLFFLHCMTSLSSCVVMLCRPVVGRRRRLSSVRGTASVKLSRDDVLDTSDLVVCVVTKPVSCAKTPLDRVGHMNSRSASRCPATQSPSFFSVCDAKHWGGEGQVCLDGAEAGKRGWEKRPTATLVDSCGEKQSSNLPFQHATDELLPTLETDHHALLCCLQARSIYLRAGEPGKPSRYPLKG